MRSVALILTTGLTLAACASGAPVLHFAPTSNAVRYAIVERTSMIIEIPGQSMETTSSVDAEVSVEVRDASAAGGVTITFVSFDIDAGNEMQSFTHDGGTLIGSAISGLFEPEVGLTLSEAPSVPSDLAEQFDPLTWLMPLFPALPEAGNVQNSWPHRYEFTDNTVFNATFVFDGQARFQGDSVVDGKTGRIIISEGIVEISGHGQPEGSPFPLDMDVTATIRTVYVWDDQTGSLLGSRAESDGSGLMAAPGFEIPIVMTGNITVTRRP